MILGTAGHIDHGKTRLVHALTGVDTDRLPEEKRRGITIELGFAPLELEGVGTVGVVDVPGHEAFVRTMLAGATGIDMAILVVAADEGVMPQTREHLAILSLLGISAGVVALTKRDLVDDEWLALAVEDVGDLLGGTLLEAAEVVPVSAATGTGLHALRDALRRAAATVRGRDADDLFRMPIDRAFTVKGTGTVVTGTVWSGSLPATGTVTLLPSGQQARVRGVQSHGRPAALAGPGQRVALSLGGVEVVEVPRGSWIVSDRHWRPTSVLRADVALLANAPALGPRTRVRFHLGAQDVGARLVGRGGAVQPGEARPVRVVLDAPVVARGGDRFVIRSASPAATIGGGVVVDPAPETRRPRPFRTTLPSADARLASMLREAGVSGVEIGSLAVRVGAPMSAMSAVVDRLPERTVEAGGRLVLASVVEELAVRLERVVREHQARHPLQEGVSLHALRSHGGNAHAAVVELVVGQLVARGIVETDGAFVHIAGWAPVLAGADRELADRVLARLEQAPTEPPSVAELAGMLGADVLPVLRFLEREGRVTAVSEDRYYSSPVVAELVERLRSGMVPGREYPPGELRELLGFSRKYLIPFLDYADRMGLTVRRDGGRVRVGT